MSAAPSRTTSTKSMHVDTEESLTEDIAIKIRDSGKSLYDILGVAPNESDQNIKRAYRRLALKLHPDKTDNEADHEQFKIVGFAYAILKDPEQRRVYDTLGFDGLDIWQIMQNKNKTCLDHPVCKGCFYFFGAITLGYVCCCCFCFCCNCCGGKCENCMSKIVGKRIMTMYYQAHDEAEVKEVVRTAQPSQFNTPQASRRNLVSPHPTQQSSLNTSSKSSTATLAETKTAEAIV